MRSLFFFIVLISSNTTWASSVYMNESPTRVLAALEQVYGIGAGVGTRNGQCTLCHLTSSGGPGNIDQSGFGGDFQAAAIRLGIPGDGGGSLNATGGSNSLEAIFSEATLRAEDSDFDGFTNEEEFIDNTDPNTGNGTSSGGGGSSGGCGMVSDINRNGPKPPTSGLLILLLPLIAALFSRRDFFKV
ncbi:MAG: hypothetical protein HRT44_05170 [Bdellovibrionales bacterium]|nr:hypothetical protein [Bdellovibrionales bacterium]NQZ18633.1 hypothetical protein [Bdellovibrionales bacterium]